MTRHRVAFTAYAVFVILAAAPLNEGLLASTCIAAAMQHGDAHLRAHASTLMHLPRQLVNGGRATVSAQGKEVSCTRATHHNT